MGLPSGLAFRPEINHRTIIDSLALVVLSLMNRLFAGQRISVWHSLSRSQMGHIRFILKNF
jgi:ATP sulfurylase